MSPVKLKPIQKIHFVISAGVFLLASIVYFQINYGNLVANYPELTETMRTLVPMAVVIGMSAGFYVRKIKLAQARQGRSLEKKIKLFTKAHFYEMALYIFTGLTATIASFLTGNSDFLLVAVAFVGILLIKFPHKKYVSKILGLTEQDKSNLI